MSVFDQSSAVEIRRAPAGWRSVVAIALSLLLPGAGHLMVHRPRRAAVFLALDGLVVWAAVWLLSRGEVGILQLLVQPQWVRAVVVGNLALGLLRLAAAVDVAIVDRPRLERLGGVMLVGALLFVLIVPHAFVHTRALSLLDLLETVFPEEGHIAAAFEQRRLEVAAERAAASQGPATTAATTTTAPFNPDVPDGTVVPHFDDVGNPQLETIDLNRVTVLLAGGDAGPGRSGLRTDTLIVASLDVSTGNGVLITLSRELTGFPLPEELREVPKIVERQDILFAAAQAAEAGGYSQATDLLPEERDPAVWMDRINAIYPFTYDAGVYRGTGPGMVAVRETVSEALGIHIDYYVLVDFAGFVDLVDALGGVTITSRETMDIRMSPAKEGEEDLILHITPGRHTLDGREALTYVRNRTDTSDVIRTRRQRCFVREVVGQVQASTVVSRFDRIARAVSRNARTDIPLSVLPDLIQVVAELDKTDIATMAIEPGYLAEDRNYRGLPVIDVTRVRAAVRNVLNGLHSDEPVTSGNECPS